MWRRLADHRPVAVGIVIACVLVGDLAALATVEEDPDPAAVLTATRRFVADRASFSFEGQVRLESHEPGAREDAAGSAVVQRLRVDGSARVPGSARFAVEDGSSVTEVLVVGAQSWTRTAASRRELPSEQWTPVDDDEDDREGVVRPGGGAAEPRDVGEPQDLLRLLDAAERPVLAGRDGGRRLVHAAVDVRRAFGELSAGMERASLEVSAASSGRLDRLTLAVVGEELDLEATYRFSRWGAPVEVAAPPPDEIDPTPSIDEEAIAAFEGAPLVQPRAIPRGWALTAAGIVSAEESAEGCEQVSVDFESPDPDTGYLYLFLIPVTCAGVEQRAEGSRPYAAGRHRGFVVVDGSSTFAQIVVGRTVVQADTDLAPEDLARVLADMVPLDLAKPPPATIGGLGRARRSA